MRRILPYWMDNKRYLGIMIVKRPHDWVYLDICWWWGGCMINLWRTNGQ